MNQILIKFKDIGFFKSTNHLPSTTTINPPTTGPPTNQPKNHRLTDKITFERLKI